jgi:GNAT superfamily N-acetyltransferase
MRVLEKCGYRREAVLRQNVKCLKKDGQIIDEVLYSTVRHTASSPLAETREHGLTLTITDDFDEGAGPAKIILDGLLTYNRQHIGDANRRKLAVFVKDQKQKLVGGLLGFTSWRWLYVDKMWIAESHRRQGLGRRIMAEAEAEARTRGCQHVHLRTGESQAPGFYEKLGYARFGQLDDFADGKKLYFLNKEL